MDCKKCKWHFTMQLHFNNELSYFCYHLLFMVMNTGSLNVTQYVNSKEEVPWCPIEVYK